MIEIDLIQVLGDRIRYNKFKKYIKPHALSDKTTKIIDDIGLYFETYPEKTDVDWPEFSTWFKYVANKSLSESIAEEYQAVFDNLSVPRTATGLPEDIIRNFIQLDYATVVADKLQHILDGSDKHKLEDLIDDIEEYTVECKIDMTAASETISTELGDVLNKCVRSGGYTWRLEDLNIGIGPLHKGDMIVIAKRPEAGGTTFATSEITHMAAQDADNRPVLIFNNEEMGEKIMLRCYQSALNKTTLEIQGDELKAVTDYNTALGGAKKIQLIDKADLNVAYCERMIRQLNPCIVVFNVLDKVQGFKKIGSEVDRQRKLAQWARGLAKRFDMITFAIAQADGSAEGEQWIYQNQIYGSKTGVPGEADVIITIGNTNDPSTENIRYIHVPKNKLPGDAKTDHTKRHGYFEVGFDGERGRFNSLTYK